MWVTTTRTLSPHPVDPGVWARTLSVPSPWNALQPLGRPCAPPWAPTSLPLSGADLGVGLDGRKDGGPWVVSRWRPLAESESEKDRIRAEF